MRGFHWEGAVLLGILFGWCGSFPAEPRNTALGKIEVLLAQHPALVEDHPCIMNAYRSVLEEEGVPFRVVDVRELARRTPPLLRHGPALILPEGVAQMLPDGFEGWVREYLDEGGSVLIGYDAGTKDARGFYRDRAVFADLIGLNYILYNESPGTAYSNGSLQFADVEAAESLALPPGKTDDHLRVVGYQYGVLQYPFARSVVEKQIAPRQTLAFMDGGPAGKCPAIVVTHCGKGTALYTGFPSGYLKCRSDDLPLRLTLRFFLFRSARIPHLLPAPSGRGGIVINWHVDSASDRAYVPLLAKNYIGHSAPHSFHVTAGDYYFAAGDHGGFDASGKGRRLLETIMPYGTFGSHGGWGHDWFADRVRSGEFKEKEIEEYIAKNNTCLEQIAGYRIREYSAPQGVHPQPETTRVLERLGMIAYYYTGDLGSAPNRTFASGAMVSEGVVAFPVMHFGKNASLLEMSRAGTEPGDVYRWLSAVADYAARNRTIRLLYFHPNELPCYPESVREFFDHLASLRKEGRLSIGTMTDFATFLLRFLKTSFEFYEEADSLRARLKNSGGLHQVTLAIPRRQYARPAISGSDLSLDEDEDYFYIAIQNPSVTEKTFIFRRR